MKYPYLILFATFLGGILLGVRFVPDRQKVRDPIAATSAVTQAHSGFEGGVAEVSGEGTSENRSIEELNSLLEDLSPFGKSLAIIDLVGTCPTDKFPELWAQTNQLGRYQKRDVRAAIFNEWGYRDPLGSLEFLRQTNGSLPPEATMIGQLFEGWALKDPDGAMAGAGQLYWPSRRVSAYRGILDMTAQQDPYKALELYRQLVREDYQTTPTLLAFELFKRSPQEAIELIEELPDSWHRRHLYRAFAEAMLQMDAGTSIRLVQNMHSDAEKRRVVGGMINSLAREDPQKAFDFRSKLPRELQDDGHLYAIFSSWADHDPQAAYGHFSGRALTPLDWKLLRKVFNQWGLQAPDRSFHESLSLGNSEVAVKIQEDAFRKIAWKDLEAGERIIDSLPEGSLKRKVEVKFVEALLRRDPARALEFAKQLDDENVLAESVSEIARHLTQQNVRQAIAFFEVAELADPVKAQAYGRILDGWFDQSPELAMDWLIGNDQLIGYSELLHDRLYDAAQLDPRWAAGIVDSIALEEQTRTRVIHRIAREWAMADLEGAQAWARGLTHAPDQWTAIDQIAREYAKSDAPGTMRWLETTSESFGAERGGTFSAILKEWHQQSPAQSLRYLAAKGDDEVWRNTFQTLAREAYRKSPNDAEALIASFPAGPNRAHAIKTVISDSLHRDPAYALRLAAQAGDESSANIIRVMRVWKQMAPDEADRALGRLKLSPSERREIERQAAAPVVSPFLER